MKHRIEAKHNRFLELVKTGQLIPRKYLRDEAALLLRKWPAYRFMSPWKATELFHALYVQAYKNYLRSDIDIETSQNTKVGVNLNWSLPNRFLTQLWGARAVSDSFGAPYDEYLEFAFRFAGRRKRTRPPQPNQLGPNINSDFAWRAEWLKFWNADRHRVAFNRMAPMLQYAIENDRGLPAQACFRHEVENLLETAPHVGSFVARYVVARRNMPEAACLPYVETDRLGRMLIDAQDEIDAGRLARASYPAPRAVDFWQSCFALPGIDIAKEPTCSICPMRNECEGVRNLCSKNVRAVSGSTNPIAEEKRRKTRERVERCRRKVKAQS